MPSSMTGFGRSELTSGKCSVTVEVRTVNNRYLNIRMKLPTHFLRHEATFEQEVRKAVARGTVDVFVRITGRILRGGPAIDERLAREYLAAVRRFARSTRLPGEFRLGDVLSLPGVVVLQEAPDIDPSLVKAVRRGLRLSLRELTASRTAEGERLCRELDGLLRRISKSTGAIARRAPRLPAQQRKRLLRRVDGLLKGSRLKLDRTTLEREVALFADRVDITEELTRLDSHLVGCGALLQKKGPVGRSLDFLVQELAREANTIGSKAQDAAIGRHVVELKADIERLREQVQNLE